MTRFGSEVLWAAWVLRTICIRTEGWVCFLTRRCLGSKLNLLMQKPWVGGIYFHSSALQVILMRFSPVSRLTRSPGEPYGHYTLRARRSNLIASSPWLVLRKVIALLSASPCCVSSAAFLLVSSTRSVLTGRPGEMVILYTQLLHSSDLSWTEWHGFASHLGQILNVASRGKKKKRPWFGFCGRQCDLADNDVSYFISGVAEKAAPCSNHWGGHCSGQWSPVVFVTFLYIFCLARIPEENLRVWWGGEMHFMVHTQLSKTFYKAISSFLHL